MYERLYQTCDEVDADDTVRVLVLRGAGGKAFVAGTDISQFTEFRTEEDGLAYERDLDRRIDRLERVGKPVIAQIEGVAVGAGFLIANACDLRIATPESRFGAPIARTLGNCLSMDEYARCLDLFGPSRLKELIFTARLLSAEELASLLTEHAPITMRVTKEAIRRLQTERRSQSGDDLVALTYTSADFHEGVRAFLEKRKPRWTGR